MITKEMNYFYYKMSMHELQMMNDQDTYHGLSYNSLLYINIISLMENCTVSKLAESLHVTKSAVTLKLKELEKAHAIQKVQSEDDKRVFYVRLTPEMEKTIGIYDEVFMKIEKKLHETYTKEQLELFAHILHDISGYEWRKLQNEHETTGT